ncbi:MAG TPA: trypsin-like serine protease, partial [Pseudonocardiaceae bacterium]|nr:trypsin-like serine protease [Pseudonocardiaceae bacterium]
LRRARVHRTHHSIPKGQSIMNKLMTAAVVGGAALAVGVLPAAGLATAATAPTPIPVPVTPTTPVTTTPATTTPPSTTPSAPPHAPSHRKPVHHKKKTTKKGHRTQPRHTPGTGTPASHRHPAHHPVKHKPVTHKPVTTPVVDPPVIEPPVAHQPVHKPRKPVAPTVTPQPAKLAVSPGIVGGKNVTDAPWAVQVSWDDTGFECSGTAVAPQWVLTAGHCASTGGMTVLIGSPRLGQGEKAVVDNKVVDPDADLALLHLADPVRTTFITLADQDPDVGSINEIYGWGKTSADSGPSDQLKSAKVKVTATDCVDGVGGRAICSTGITGNAFNGDSGGPEIADGTEVGVCSTGNADDKTQEYTSVAANRAWIRQVANV